MTASNPNYANQDATSADQAKQSATQVADQTKQAAQQVTDQTKQAAKSQLAARKDQTANGLHVVSSAVRDMGDKLRQNDQTASYAQFADQAANQVQRMAGSLRNHDVRDIADDAEDWARRDPMLALGGAFVLGLLAARFLKSSGMQRRSSNTNTQQYRGYTPTYRYNNQYSQSGRYGDSRDYGASYRPTGQYWDDQYRATGDETKESNY